MELRLHDVTFSYDGTRNVLENGTMVFPGQGMTAVVGESGCGKSTVVQLLLGALRPQSGSVTVGGIPMAQLSREGFYRRVGVVSCGTHLFNQTVRENFQLAKPDVTDGEIRAALARVKLADLPLDKMIEEDGANLSGGQRQRLALAMALVTDKDVYLFDEATSNIDADSEAVIMGAIRELARTKSVIVISHRLENIVPADHIYYLSGGTVQEQGTHGALLAQNGGYARLYRMQKELEEVV